MRASNRTINVPRITNDVAEDEESDDDDDDDNHVSETSASLNDMVDGADAGASAGAGLSEIIMFIAADEDDEFQTELLIYFKRR